MNQALVQDVVAEVMKRLDALYTHERMWPELLENLRLQAGVTTDDGARRFLKKRIGALLAGQLEDPAQALEAYREVIATEYDSDAATAIREIGEAREELRAEAADALEPVLRNASRWSDLADVLEMRLDAVVGARALNTKLSGVRRLHLIRVRYHIYYRVRRSTVEVLAFWHSSRGIAPRV